MIKSLLMMCQKNSPLRAIVVRRIIPSTLELRSFSFTLPIFFFTMSQVAHPSCPELNADLSAANRLVYRIMEESCT
jgi:hypothetical protein